MNELIKIDEQTKTVSARNLWEKLGSKQDFTDWIKNRIDKFNFIKDESYTIILSDRSDGKPGKGRDEYSLKLDAAIQICSSENNDIGREFLNELIKYINKPRQLSRLEIIELALDSEKKRIVAEEKLLIAEPKADQYDLFMNSTNAISMGQVAKALGAGRNKLFEYLRELGMLDQDNVPYQQYINQLYFDVVRKNIPTGESKSVTLVTPKGFDYISKKIRLKAV